MDASPCSIVLDDLKLTTTEAALAADCGPHEVSRARSGGPIPLKLRLFLDQAGIDVCALERNQTAYRQARASEIRERVCGRGGPIPAATRCAAAGSMK